MNYLKIGKGETNPSLFTGNMIVYVENPKTGEKKVLKLRKYVKFSGIKAIYKISCFPIY